MTIRGPYSLYWEHLGTFFSLPYLFCHFIYLHTNRLALVCLFSARLSFRIWPLQMSNLLIILVFSDLTQKITSLSYTKHLKSYFVFFLWILESTIKMKKLIISEKKTHRDLDIVLIIFRLFYSSLFSYGMNERWFSRNTGILIIFLLGCKIIPQNVKYKC